MLMQLDASMTIGYTGLMKTAISLPDELFERGERVARQLNLNRSQLYSRALQEFLKKHDPASITAAFNEVYNKESSTIDPALMQMQMLSLSKDEW